MSRGAIRPRVFLSPSSQEKTKKRKPNISSSAPRPSLSRPHRGLPASDFCSGTKKLFVLSQSSVGRRKCAVRSFARGGVGEASFRDRREKEGSIFGGDDDDDGPSFFPRSSSNASLPPLALALFPVFSFYFRGIARILYEPWPQTGKNKRKSGSAPR